MADWEAVRRCLVLAACVAALLAPAAAAWQVDDFPGWMGDGYQGSKQRLGGGKSLLRGPDPIFIDPTRVIQLSWRPRAFLYKNFLTDEECDHLVELARPHLRKSMVSDNESGKPLDSEIRTSHGMFITHKDEVVKRVEDKIAAWTFLPKENGEAIQVLRYNYGQKYDAHFDYFHDKLNAQMGGHRVATVLMYLSDVIKGGETVFPSSEEDRRTKDDSWSDCGKRGVAVKPRKGDALLFFSLHPDATVDESSLHSGCPVIEGEKWSATKWIHVSSFDQSSRDPNKCINDDPRCDEWAAAGECQKNKPYMIGEGDFIGSCRKACKACGAAALA